MPRPSVYTCLAGCLRSNTLASLSPSHSDSFCQRFYLLCNLDVSIHVDFLSVARTSDYLSDCCLSVHLLLILSAFMPVFNSTRSDVHPALCRSPIQPA
ncbi:unnamed protein product [Protopolystoma xenopodis]|uniref:Uncharacterized protein n=1 Tax=Protopolystoma xenopodis TaxID=117903 RepID=A0A448XSC6_9PLAT|nr:unnamed protein product [Protopolystoma xenopodis]